jgi:hypothetical protein
MAVSKAAIEAAFNALDAQAQSTEMTKEQYNAERAQIIVDAILSATVTTTVTGTLPAGPVAAAGTGTLS